jgi:hypothetical protein
MKKSLEKGNARSEKVKVSQPFLRIGIVTARFNPEITERLEEGAIKYLEEIDHIEIEAVRVPGAIEIPLACKVLLESGCAADQRYRYRVSTIEFDMERVDGTRRDSQSTSAGTCSAGGLSRRCTHMSIAD